ncbi:hypothetical protein TrLO_g4475 [Triparma laevis f. longispina]|uniref:MIR domain-containing protein n=1 Tax=Triparma laevis f. longispina TaxID=1714387 RepID=A0A9W7FTQ0_9STRA|nr:hypothetical protein TrLO_g4475 [Triparma laevis f. longispina]
MDVPPPTPYKSSFLSFLNQNRDQTEDEDVDEVATRENTLNLDALFYGDVIYFYHRSHAYNKQCHNNSVFSGFMHADPCIERVGFQTMHQHTPGNFHDCLFQILPMLNYDSTSASTTLQRRPSFKSSATETAMMDLRVKQELKQNQNSIKKYMTGNEKTNVLYGHIVQLKHLSTGKYLQGDTYTADKERDCLKLTLSEGDENCHFRIMPRFRVRREGSIAYYGDMMHLRSERLHGYALRISGVACDEHEDEPRVNEANLSLQPSGLKILKFYRPGERDMTLINTNIDYVSFFHPETSRYLQGSCAKGQDADENFAALVKHGNAGANMTEGPGTPRSLTRRVSGYTMFSGRGSVVGENEHNDDTDSNYEDDDDDEDDDRGMNENTFLKLDPNVTEDTPLPLESTTTSASHKNPPFFSPLMHPTPSNPLNLSAKSMFIFEYKSRLSSGFVRWADPVRIRHVATGRYLGVDPTPINGTAMESDSKRLYCSTMVDHDEGDLERTLFYIIPTDKQGEFVPESQVSLRIEHHLSDNVVLHATSKQNKAADSLGFTTSDGASDSHHLMFASKRNEHDALVMMPLQKESKFEKSMKLALAMVLSLDWFANRVISRRPLRYEHIRRTERILAKLIFFSDRFFNSVEFDKREMAQHYDPLDALNANHEVSRSFQFLAKDTKLLDKVFKVAVAPTTIPNIDMSFSQSRQKFTGKTFSHLSGVVKLAWKALENIISDNRDNENYFASHDNWINPAMVVQMPYPLGAESTFARLITNNGKLLESVIDSSMLLAFENLILHHGPHARLMNFFSAICSCLGEPILSNQETILTHLILDQERNNKIMLQIYEDPNSSPKQWEFNNSESDRPDDYLGKAEVTIGVKDLIVDWSKVACLEEFFINDKQSCNIVQFCEPLEDLENSKRGAFQKQKRGGKRNSSYSERRRGRTSSSPKSPRGSTTSLKQMHRDLIHYLVAQIELFANMSSGRSYNCIYALEKKFPYVLLCSLVSQHELPFIVKRSFCDLLRCLWIDRYPHTPVADLRINWIVSDLRSCSIDSSDALETFKLSEQHQLRHHKDEFYRFPSSSKFFICNDFIVRYFQDMGGEQIIGHRNENDMTTAVLSLTHHLVAFGFFGSEAEIKDLLDSVVNALDGRNDSFEKNSNSRLSTLVTRRKHSVIDQGVNSNLMQLSIRSQEGSAGRGFIKGLMNRTMIGSLRYGLDSSSLRVMDCKTNILKILESVSKLRANFRLSQILAHLKYTMESERSVVVDATTIETILTNFEDLNVLDVELLSSAPIDSVLLDLARYDSDDLFENALKTFKNRYTEVNSLGTVLPQLIILNDSRIPIFEDFACLTESRIQLTFYLRSYEVWAVKSVSPMNVRSYNHICYLLNKVLTFLYSPSYDSSSFEDFSMETKEDRIKRIEKYCVAERNAMDKKEQKSISHSQIEPNTKIKVAKARDKQVSKRSDSVSDFTLFGYNSSPSALVQLRRNKTPNKLHQDLLRSMGFVPNVLQHALAIEMKHAERIHGLANDKTTDPTVATDTEKSESWLFDVVKKAIFVACGLVHDNPKCQEDMFEVIDLILNKIDITFKGREVFIWDLIIFIFDKNRNLCEMAPKNVIAKMSEILAKNSPTFPRLLDFFLIIVYPVKHESCVIANQNQTIELLTTATGSSLLLEFPHDSPDPPPESISGSPSKKNFFEKLVGGGGDDDDDQTRDRADTYDRNEHVEFHIKSVELLALCAKGRNSKAAAKCQSLLDLSSAMERLYSKDTSNNLRLKTATVNYIHFVFIDTKLVDRKLSEKREIFQLLGFAYDEISIMVEHFSSSDSYLKGHVSDCGGGSPSSRQRRNSSTNDSRHLERTTYNLDSEDLQTVPVKEVKDYCLALLQMTSSILEVVMNGEVRMKYGTKVLTEVRRGLRKCYFPQRAMGHHGEAKDNVEINSAHQKCLDILDQRLDGEGAVVGTFRPGGRTGELQLTRVQSAWWNGASSSSANAAGKGSAVKQSPSRKEESFEKALQAVAKEFQRNERVQGTILAAQESLLSTVEEVDRFSDPMDREYLEAGIGFSIYQKKKKKGKRSLRERWGHLQTQTLKMLQGTRMLVLILTFVMIAAVCTITQIAQDATILWVNTVEEVITWFFIVELTIRVWTYIHVYGELDSFLFDPLNLCDILVVTIDLIIIFGGDDEGGSENDQAGLVKALRSARGVRLLRVLRAARALRLLKKKRKMTQTEALADPRSCQVTFHDLAKRFLKYCDTWCGDAEKEEIIHISLTLLCEHLRKGLYLRENPTEMLTDIERLRMTTTEIKRKREETHITRQHNLTNDAGAPKVILKILSTCNGLVVEDALTLGEQLLCSRNYNGQGIFFKMIDRGGRDGSFFISMRNTIRESRESLQQYRKFTREARSNLSSKMVKDMRRNMKKALPLLKFLSLLCEGHYEQTQNLMRHQPRNTITINVLQEVVDLLFSLGKSLPQLRVFQDFEGDLTLACLSFLVEATQGPCKENQDYLGNARKPVDICKNIFCTTFTRLKGEEHEKLTMQLYSKAMQLIAALLESRGRDVSLHLILRDQIPPKMLSTRLVHCKKKDIELAKKISESYGAEKKKWKALQAINTSESISIYNTTLELKPFSTEENDFGFIDSHVLGTAGLNGGLGGGGGEDDESMGEDMDDLGWDDTDRELNFGDGEGVGGEEDLYGGAALENDEEEELNGREQNFVQVVDAIELVWHGECIKVHYTLPSEWRSFSERKMEEFLDSVDCATAESRMKGLIDQSDDMLELMRHFAKLKDKSNFFSFVNQNFMACRMVVFAFTLVMNVNMMLSKFQSIAEIEGSTGDWRDFEAAAGSLGHLASLTTVETWNIVLSLIVVGGNFVVCLFVSVSELPLALTRSRRQREIVSQSGSSVSKNFSWTPLLNFGGSVLVYVLLCEVHRSSYLFGLEQSQYVNYGLLIFGLAFPFSLRSSLKAPRSRLLNLFLDIFDTLKPAPFLMSFFQLIVSWIGLFYPFMNMFLLLDAGNMSKSLKLCFKAILLPFKQLCLTIMFFVIVISVYTAVAFEAFGIEGFKEENAHLDCNSFFDCFVLTTYVTFRHSDISEILDFPESDSANYGSRIVFDLTFFIICGMFLFNMIGGLILDTFTHIRDEREKRTNIYNSECFVSGITRNTIEEDPRYRFISFSRLNDEDQNVWKYLYFIIYLRNKDSDEYTGVESYVSKCLSEESLEWLPSKVCCAQTNVEREVGPDMHAVSKRIEVMLSKIVGDYDEREEGGRLLGGGGGGGGGAGGARGARGGGGEGSAEQEISVAGG